MDGNVINIVVGFKHVAQAAAEILGVGISLVDIENSLESELVTGFAADPDLVPNHVDDLIVDSISGRLALQGFNKVIHAAISTNVNSWVSDGNSDGLIFTSDGIDDRRFGLVLLLFFSLSINDDRFHVCRSDLRRKILILYFLENVWCGAVGGWLLH